MPVDMSYFRAIQNATGCNNLKDVSTNQYLFDFAHDFNSSMGFASVTINGRSQNLIITPMEKKHQCRIFARPDECFESGEVVTWTNRGKTTKWLITEMLPESQLQIKGEMEQCNYVIRWQNPTTGEIIMRDCIAVVPHRATIEDFKQIISESNQQYKVRVPYDDETKLINLDKRFMLSAINGKAATYSIVSVDVISDTYSNGENGVITWTLKRDESSANRDNISLMICDYISPVPPPVNPFDITYEYTPDIILNGNSSVFTADTEISVEWTVDGTENVIGSLTITPIGNTVNILCSGDGSLYGTHFTLIATGTNGSVSNLQVNIVGGI